MKFTAITLMVFFFVQASFAQDTDTVATFKIRMPVAKEPATGFVYTTGLYPSPRTVVNPRTNPSVINPSDGVMYTKRIGVVKQTLLDLHYPVAAIDSGITGLVKVSYEVGDDGNAIKLILEEGAHPLLNEAALNYVRNMPPEPEETIKYMKRERRKGRIPAYTLPITFSLE